LTGKYFPLTNFSNGKQTQESLESGFLETSFRETNTTLERFFFWSLAPKNIRTITHKIFRK